MAPALFASRILILPDQCSGFQPSKSGSIHIHTVDNSVEMEIKADISMSRMFLFPAARIDRPRFRVRNRCATAKPAWLSISVCVRVH